MRQYFLKYHSNIKVVSVLPCQRYTLKNGDANDWAEVECFTVLVPFVR